MGEVRENVSAKKSLFLKSSLLFFALLLFAGNGSETSGQIKEEIKKPEKGRDAMIEKRSLNPSLQRATFAGGCFWCMEPPFEREPGVLEVKVGYTGGFLEKPGYNDVSTGRTGHYEAVEIVFDPSIISYKKLLEIFWRNIDPTDRNGQFVDKGSQYKTAIFYHDDNQKKDAIATRDELERSGKFKLPIATVILPAKVFYPAEEYHQDYYLKNPLQYERYKKGSGRQDYLETMSKIDISKINPSNPGENPSKKSISKNEIVKQLTPLQYRVTQKNETEPPFNNDYWDNHREGIYVDVVSGEVLFTSKEKFDSGTGWPCFSGSVKPEALVEKVDTTHSMVRTEVRGKGSDSHLGHVFNDGPKPGGLRYCINSAALRFIPRDSLKKEGYGEYERFFK